MICAGSSREDRRLLTARHAGRRVSRGHSPWLEGCLTHLWTRCDVVLRIAVEEIAMELYTSFIEALLLGVLAACRDGRAGFF